MKIEPFDIRFIKQVVFRDIHGAVTRTYEVGDVIQATADARHYFVTGYGGIFKDEAVRVDIVSDLPK